MVTTVILTPDLPEDRLMLGFELIQEDSEDGIRELRLRGELDLAVAGRLADAIAAAGEEGRSVLIDLDRCEFIDSTGIAVIIRGRAALAESGLSAVACRPARQVKRVLDLIGLSDHGVVFSGREQALEALRTR
jgi:anti-anti-sigma factor